MGGCFCGHAGLDPASSYLGGLQKFSVHARNTLEDHLVSGHRIDCDFSASVTVRRPNKLRAARQGDVMDQRFFYDGKTLTLYNTSDKVYGTAPAPETIEKTIAFARESLGLVIPAADLLYRNAFPLLMEDVTLAGSYNVVKPGNGPEWSLRFQIALLFPEKWKR